MPIETQNAVNDARLNFKKRSERRVGFLAEEQKNRYLATAAHLTRQKPETWNNIPQPVMDLLVHLVRFVDHSRTNYTNQEAILDDLLNGLDANFTYDERMFDELRHKTLMKILQLNSKSEVELSTARKELLANTERVKHETIMISRQNSNEIVSKEAAALKNWTEVKIRNMKGDLEGYIQKQIEKGI